jgi:hypothetical protein
MSAASGATGANRPATRADVKTLLDRWAEALGGRDRLERLQGLYMRESGDIGGVPVVQETWIAAAGAYRTRRDVLGRVTETTFDGHRGWRSDFTGRLIDLESLADEMQDAYVASCSQLLPGRRHGKVSDAAPDSDGRPALHVKARGGYDEVYYFDPTSGLPARVVRRYDDSTRALREYADWRDVGGVRIPFVTVLWNGPRRDTVRVTEARTLEAPPVFARVPGPRPWRILDGAVAHDIPIEINNNHILLRGRIQDRDSVLVTLDSGAATDVMLASRAQSLGLDTRGTHEAMGAAGAAAASTVSDVSLTIPRLALEHHTFDTLPLDQLGPQAGHPIDAIVGYPLFSRNVVAIDYEHERMTVYDGDGWTYHGKGVVLPLTFESNLPYVEARVTLPGGSPITGRFVLDTGNAGNLILAPSWVADHQALEHVRPTVEVVSRAVGGEARNPIGRIDRFELGGVRLERPVTMLRSPGPGAISAPGTAGNIGGGILRRFTVIFDYPRRRLILEPNARVADPFEYDMSGLALRAVPPAFDKVQVGLVLPNSPASELGIVPGDEIETIDGRPPAELGLDAIRKRFRVEGTTFQIGIRHGEERRTVTLVTRRLI